MMFLNKRMFKICFSALSFLLCLLIIFNAGIVDCFAVAGIDDGVFWLLVAVMASCGITFSSIDDAHTACDALYLNFDDALKSVIDSVGNQIAIDGVGATVGVKFLQNEWSKIIDGIIATFGTYESINTLTNLTDLSFTGVTPDNPFTYTVECNNSSITQYQISNLTHTVVGCNANTTGYVFPSHIKLSDSKFTEIISIAGIFTCYWSQYGGSSFKLTESIRYSGNSLAYSSTLRYFSKTLYFNGVKLLQEFNNSGGFVFTANGVNIVQDGYIIGTDIPVSDSVCPDGIWTEKSFSDWLNDLIFGNTLPGNPSIDVGAYPGNDVWHDGIDDGIGIAVPKDLTNDNIADLSPDTVRDYDNTDTKVDTTTGDGDQSDTKPKPSNGTPSKILPQLSLPEILFKEKFPFCLPWDIYNLFVGLQSSEAEAPKFVIPYKNDMLGIYEEYTIDLSQFDDAAKIIRFFLGAGFVLALILISRKIVGAE